MSHIGDSHDEMVMSYYDAQVEKLLSGQVPNEPQLARLTGFIASLRESASRFPQRDPSDIIALATLTVREATAGRASVLHSPRRRRRPVFRPALVAASLVFSMASVAVAADGAAPGDPLYGLDLALERVGIGAGGLNERLREVSHLVATDRPREAITHLSQSLGKADTDELARQAHRIDHHLNRAVAASGMGLDRARDQIESIRTLIDSKAKPGLGDQVTPPGQNTNPGQGNQGTPPGLGNEGHGGQGETNPGTPRGPNGGRGQGGG